jgi:hypothetical protein
MEQTISILQSSQKIFNLIQIVAKCEGLFKIYKYDIVIKIIPFLITCCRSVIMQKKLSIFTLTIIASQWHKYE